MKRCQALHQSFDATGSDFKPQDLRRSSGAHGEAAGGAIEGMPHGFRQGFLRRKACRQASHCRRCCRAAAWTSASSLSSKYSCSRSLKSSQFMMCLDCGCRRKQKGSFPWG